MSAKSNELSDGWIECLIEDVVGKGGIFKDGDWVESKDQDPSGDVRLIQLADIGDGRFVDKSSRFLTKSKALELNCTFLRAGDILVARMPDPLGRCCIFPLAGNEQYVTVVDICAIRFGDSRINAKFMMYLINSPSIRGKISALQSGSTRKRISRGNLATIPLPLPPLNEQHRIVAKIETLFSELDKGIESLKTAREQLKVYRQAVLKHAFEGNLTAHWREQNKDKLETPEQLLASIQQERQARYQQQLQDWQAAVKAWEESRKEGKKPGKPRQPEPEKTDNPLSVSLPAEWAWVSVGALNTNIFDGPFGSNLKSSDYVESGVRVIRLENIGYSEFIEDKYSYVTEIKYRNLARHTVRKGDLIFSSFITEGIRVAILPESIDRAINKADCFCIRVHGKSIRNDYLASFLSTRAAYKQVEAEIHGIGRPRINTTQLKGFYIPVCSQAEQDEIMLQIEGALSLMGHFESEIEKELGRTETLRQSILKKAFSGQLVPQDPDDEPASALLARIQSEIAVQPKLSKSRKKSIRRGPSEAN